MGRDTRISRGIFLGTGGKAAAGLLLVPAATLPKLCGVPLLPGAPFTLGMASGDLRPDGVVFWTRLAPEPLNASNGGGMPRAELPVRWEVAHDEGFRRIARRGTVTATPDLAHSVHAEVEGLEPARLPPRA